MLANGVEDELFSKAQSAREAVPNLIRLSTITKDRALRNIADGLVANQTSILEANRKDIQVGVRDGLTDAMLDRLLLNHERLRALAVDVIKLAELPDPVGEAFDVRSMPNGLRIGRRRVPLGVIGVIYESRPNVTIDISTLCLKSGNAVILRGGRESIHSNTALVRLVRDSIAEAGVSPDVVQFVESTDRALVTRMLEMKGYIDLLIPRGGGDLIRRVAEEATMPSVTGGMGVCHTYVDESADLDMAINIVNNAKVSRPSVCNALDSLIVHSTIASVFLMRLAEEWKRVGVEMHCDRRSFCILDQSEGLQIKEAIEDDWNTEFLSLKLAVKTVDSLDEAINHIEKYGSGHSDAIVTENYSAAMKFLDIVDSAVVLVNASTRFNDGGELGLGAEVAISTDKIHARGPMGLREIMSYKWTIFGTGQIRE